MKMKKITAMLLAFVLIVLQIPFVAASGSGDTTVSSTLVVTDNNDQPTQWVHGIQSRSSYRDSI